MIGKKRHTEVRAGLLEECAKSGIAPARWFDEQGKRHPLLAGKLGEVDDFWADFELGRSWP